VAALTEYRGGQTPVHSRGTLGVNSRIIPATANDVTKQSSGTGIGSRWLTFEQRLRQRRVDLSRDCPTARLLIDPRKTVAQERKAV